VLRAKTDTKERASRDVLDEATAAPIRGPRPGLAVPSIEFCRPLGGRLAIGRGHNVLITDADGRLGGGPTGFFHHQSRFLALAELRVRGRRPTPASACVIAHDALTTYFVASLPPKRTASGELGRPTPRLEIQVDIRIGRRCTISYRFTNRSLERVRAPVEWRFAADFIDQADLQRDRRRPVGVVVSRRLAPCRLEFRCENPRLRHRTRIAVSGPIAVRMAGDAARANLDIATQDEIVVEVEVTPLFDENWACELPSISDADPRAWLEKSAKLDAPDPTVQAAWDQAARDLAGLQLGDGAGEEGFTPAAGFPHYVALFGRDALTAGWQTGLLNPATLRGALSLVGRWTASALEPERDAQPGRVLHQRQLGPAALLGRSPFLRYYGDHSASALFLLGVAKSYAQTGDREGFLSHRDLALRTLDWMDRYGDLDGDGLYEYRGTAKGGLKNQGWKDSDDAILYPDGSIPRAPIVVCEVQALFFAAKAAMAGAFGAAGDHRRADELARQAEAARRRFSETMWMEDEGFVALGLDADKRQIRTLASNAGECLAYGVLDAARAGRVADRLMRPDFFTGWGIRTLSARHPAFDPLGYHIGSVWPCSTALAARGLARYGLAPAFHALARALFEATGLFDRQRLPELFGGHARDREHPHPGIYPNACSPQAWSAAAIILLVDTMIGLKPAAPFGVALVDPKLPPWLPELTIRGVSLGEGRLDLRVWRKPDGVGGWEVLANSSGLKLVGPQGAGAGARALVEALP
jgi:glycogen debranching enzyme